VTLTALCSLAGSDTPIGDVVTAIVWSALAVGSVALVVRLPRGSRGAWLVVAIYCSVVAADKIVDLQTAVYLTAKWTVGALQPFVELRSHRNAIRVGLVLVLLSIGIGGTVWLVRRDRALDLPRLLALGGLLLVMAMVGGRLVRGSPFADEVVGWVVEGIGCTGIAVGLVLGWRRSVAEPHALTK
jgi:hypothetical protein